MLLVASQADMPNKRMQSDSQTAARFVCRWCGALNVRSLSLGDLDYQTSFYQVLHKSEMSPSGWNFNIQP